MLRGWVGNSLNRKRREMVDSVLTMVLECKVG